MNEHNRLKELGYVISFRILIPLLLTALAVKLLIFVSQQDLLSKFLSTNDRDYEIWQIFYSLISTLYAICVAFLLVKEMQDFSELKTSFKKEAFVLKSISMYLYYLEDEINDKDWQAKRNRIIRNIKTNAAAYIKMLLRYDLKGKSSDTHQDIESKLWNCVKEIAEITPNDENDRIALANLMHKFEELFMLRATRSGWIDNGLSPYLLFFLLVLSMVILFPFFTFFSIDPTITIVAFGTLVFFLLFLLGTLLDVGNPFSGHWKIPDETYKKLLEQEYKTD